MRSRLPCYPNDEAAKSLQRRVFEAQQRVTDQVGNAEFSLRTKETLAACVRQSRHEGGGLKDTNPGAPGLVNPQAKWSRRAMLGLVGMSALAACTNDGPKTPTAASGSSTSAPPTEAPEPNPTTAPPQPPPDELYYGASTPQAELAAFEAELGSPLSCHRSFFKHWEVPALVAQAQSDLAAARVPLTSIKPPASWAETARDNAWLDSLMEPLAQLSGPVYLIINHEPENDAHHSGTAADYVGMQQAALTRATMAGGMLTVVPILSSWSFDEQANRTPREWNVPEAPIYGLDLYNPWAEHNGNPWVPFADKLALAEQEAAGRPVLVGEYGCRSDPSKPGRAARWMQDAFDTSLAEGVVAMSYFNSSVGATDGTWELDSETLPVFKDILHSDQVARV